MTMARVYLAEAWHELRAGFRGSLVPLMFVGLVAYVFTMLTNAQYVRDMGGADVPRNSALAVYQITSGQSFWLIFIWAWVFAQVVTRDRAAHLHELVLSAPVSLPGLLCARYVGALALACILGTSSSIALLLLPALGATGIVPANAVGPTPLAEIVFAWLVFVLPSAVGLGGIYVVTALRTRSTGGPFAAAAVIVLAWMAAMVVFRSGDIDSEAATLIDVSGFGEAQHQTKLWTPSEKARGFMVLTRAFVLNRALWTLIPLAVFGFTLWRLRRETLVLERDRNQPARRGDVAPHDSLSARALPPVTAPSWLVATLNDARWQFRRAISGWTFLMTALLWTVLNVAAPFVHMLGHAEGPLVPRAQILAPFLVDLCYLLSMFIVAGFVGALVRRDQPLGFAEMIDATPAPVGVRVVASAVTATAVTLVLAFIPTVATWIVTSLTVSGGFDLWSPVLVNGLVAAPALLELSAVTFLIHSLVRSAGTAHALSMFAGFVAIVNHEIGIVSYPPAAIGIPGQVSLSEFVGFQPWLAALGVLDVHKLAGTVLMIAVAWLAYARGTALTTAVRARAVWERLHGGAGLLALTAFVALAATTWLLHVQLVTRGGYRAVLDQQREDAAWEQRFWSRANAFSLTGGDVVATIDPESQRAHTTLRLFGVQATEGRVSGELPTGAVSIAAQVDGRPQDVATDFSHFELDVGVCPPAGCEVTLDLDIAADGWGLQDTPPWLHRSGVWARATDLVPRLGLDAERRLRAPTLRRAYALPDHPSAVPVAALASAHGVAPAGQWRWKIHVTQPGAHTPVDGAVDGPLDFALAWLPAGRLSLRDTSGFTVWHGPTRGQDAADVVEDMRAMQGCIGARTAMPAVVDTVLQAPRELGSTAVHGRVLWLPEHDGWDVASVGMGRIKRRATIGHALASSALATVADLRVQPGSRWLTAGVAGWLALECVRELDGADAALAWMARASTHTTEALGALDAPIISLADDGAATWVDEYAPLATFAWAQSLSHADARSAIRSVVARVRAGLPIREALALTVGEKQAALLLGVPFASDVAVEERAGGIDVHGQRARWYQGGWQVTTAEFPVTQRFSNDSASRVAPLPLRIEGESHVVVFDAEPSFERSPLDNIWPPQTRRR
jgi:hypothetical protein